MNIYVGNLSYSVTEQDLKEAFSEFGEVASVNIINDRNTGQSKGFGFVEMTDNSEADKAIKALNGVPLKNREIKVNPAKPKSSGSRGGGGRGGYGGRGGHGSRGGRGGSRNTGSRDRRY